MIELPELTLELKRLLYQIEQARLAQLRAAESAHNVRISEIEHDYRYRMVDAGLEAYIAPTAAQTGNQP